MESTSKIGGECRYDKGEEPGRHDITIFPMTTNSIDRIKSGSISRLGRLPTPCSQRSARSAASERPLWTKGTIPLLVSATVAPGRVRIEGTLGSDVGFVGKASAQCFARQSHAFL